MDAHYFGKRKRERSVLGERATMTTVSCTSPSSNPTQKESSSLQYQPRKTVAKLTDDSSLSSQAAISSVESSNHVPSPASSRYSDEETGYEPFSEGEGSNSPSSCFTASVFTSEDETGGDEVSSCASTTAFIEDEEESIQAPLPVRIMDHKPRARDTASAPSQLLRLGPDVMVSLVKFLEPAETLRFLTMPLCREWRQSYTAHPDLWKTLCGEDPFSAKLNKNSSSACAAAAYATSSDEEYSSNEDDDDDDSFCTLGEEGIDMDDDVDGRVLSEHRLLYTSFVRCMKYLDRIQEDALSGRPPSVTDYGGNYSRFPTFGVTKSLKKFLSKKKHDPLKSVIGDGSGSFQSNPPFAAASAPIGVTADGTAFQKVRLFIL